MELTLFVRAMNLMYCQVPIINGLSWICVMLLSVSRFDRLLIRPLRINLADTLVVKKESLMHRVLPRTFYAQEGNMYAQTSLK